LKKDAKKAAELKQAKIEAKAEKKRLIEEAEAEEAEKAEKRRLKKEAKEKMKKMKYAQTQTEVFQ
jgi:hypothetical protein